jgi:hypothetical protein
VGVRRAADTPALDAETAVATAPEPATATLIADTAIHAAAEPALAVAPAEDAPGDAAARPTDAAPGALTDEAAPAVSALEKSAEAKARPGAEVTDGAAPRSGPAPGGGRLLLPAGFIGLTVVLLITAADVFGSSPAAGPWWGTACVSVAGIAATLGGCRLNRVAAWVVLVNLCWYLIYSVSVIATVNNTSGWVPTLLGAESVAGAAVNVGLCAWMLVVWKRLAGALYPLLAAVTAGVAIAQVLNAIVLLTLKLSIWNGMAWVCIITAVGGLAAAALAREPGTPAS